MRQHIVHGIPCCVEALERFQSIHPFLRGRDFPFPPTDVRLAECFVRGCSTAEGEEIKSFDRKDLPAHEVEDVVRDAMDIPAMPWLHGQTLNPFVVFMVAVYPEERERLLAEPLEPMAVFLVIMPEETEIAEYDNIVLSGHLFLLGKVRSIELADINGDMGVPRKVNHGITSLPFLKMGVLVVSAG